MVFCEILVKKSYMLTILFDRCQLFFPVASSSIFARAGIDTIVDACASGAGLLSSDEHVKITKPKNSHNNKLGFFMFSFLVLGR